MDPCRKNSLLEEMMVLCIVPVSFMLLFFMFGGLRGDTYFLIMLSLSSGVIYFSTRWLWFDKKNNLGMGIDEFTRKNGGKYKI